MIQAQIKYRIGRRRKKDGRRRVVALFSIKDGRRFKVFTDISERFSLRPRAHREFIQNDLITMARVFLKRNKLSEEDLA